MNAISCHHFGRRIARTRAGSSARARRGRSLGATVATIRVTTSLESRTGTVCQTTCGRRCPRRAEVAAGIGILLEEMDMARRRLTGARTAWIGLAVGALSLGALTVPSFGGGHAPVGFGKP